MLMIVPDLVQPLLTLLFFVHSFLYFIAGFPTFIEDHGVPPTKKPTDHNTIPLRDL